MGKDRVEDADPERLGKAVGEKGQNEGTEAGDQEGGGEGDQPEEEKQPHGEDPENAGDGVVQGNGAEAPSVLVLKRQPAGRAVRVQAVAGFEYIPGSAARAASPHTADEAGFAAGGHHSIHQGSGVQARLDQLVELALDKGLVEWVGHAEP